MTTITVRSVQGYQQEIIAGDHILFADEPIDVGGDDTGPNPYELLLGALGACTAITMRMYATRKQWPLESIEIELTHSRDYAKDCETCAESDVKLDRITRRIELRGELDDSQRERLLEIARRCPVHRTFTEGEIEIVDEAVAD
jgi:putative redox protein